MKVHFTFKTYTGKDRSTIFKTFDDWTNPLPSAGDFISHENGDIYRHGLVSRLEWCLEEPNDVYVIIDC